MNQLFHRLSIRKSHRNKATSADSVTGDERPVKPSNMIHPSSRTTNARTGSGTGSGSASKSSANKSRVTHINIQLAPSKPKQRPWKKKSQRESERTPRPPDASTTEDDSVSRNESVRMASGTSHGAVQGPAMVSTATPHRTRAASGSHRTTTTRSTSITSPESHASFESNASSPSLNSACSIGSSDSHVNSSTRSRARDAASDEHNGYQVDYRGHYVVAKQPNEHDMDAVVQMALQASQKALLSGKTATHGAAPAATKHRERESASERLDESGNDLFEEGKLDQAFEMYEEALRIKRLALLGQYNALQHSSCGASSLISNQERNRILVSMATSINNLTYLRQVRGTMSAQETLESYEMALHIKRECLGSDHISVGKTLSNIGSVYYLQESFHEAAAYYEEARDILKLHLGPDSLDVSTVTSNLGDVHCSMRQWHRAVTEYRAALELRWRLLGPQDAKTIRLVEQIAELEMEIDRARNKRDSKDGSEKGSGMDRSKRYYRPVLTDLRKLQKELRDDLESFSMLERQWPIDMIKDKASLFRDLRELKGDVANDDESQLDVLLGPDDSTHDDSTYATLTGLLDDDLALMSPSHEKGSMQLDLVHSTLDGEIHKVPASIVVTPETDDCVHYPADDVLSSHAIHADWPSPTRQLEIVPSPEQSPVSPVRSVISPAVDQFPRLSPQQRRQALQDVRERLAQLRAGKDAVPDFNVPSLPLSTQCLTTLQSTPGAPSFLVKTSELLTMKQGIDALRTMPNQVLPEAEARPKRHIQRKPRPPKLPTASRIVEAAPVVPPPPKSPRLSFTRCTGLIQ